MEKEIKMNAYECMFIADISAGVDAAAPTVQKFVNLIDTNGEIVDVAEWGKRRFEYPINDKNEGYYTVVTFKAQSDFPTELERLLNIDESVMRSMVVKIDDAVAERVARRAADRAAAAAAAEAEAQAAAEAAPAEEPAAEEAAPVAETAADAE
ncbi:MAG: 30S ribosomal protein S6 [Eubacteriales bacterium]